MTANDVLRDIAANAALVFILTQAVKNILPERLVPWIPLGAICGAVLLNVAISLLIGTRMPELLVNAALVGVFGAGSAVGIYSAQKPVGVVPPRPE